LLGFSGYNRRVSGPVGVAGTPSWMVALREHICCNKGRQGLMMQQSYREWKAVVIRVLPEIVSVRVSELKSTVIRLLSCGSRERGGEGEGE
jgi:hypothetical protein